MSRPDDTIGEDDYPPATPAISFAQANARHFDCEAHRYEHHAGTRELVRRVARAMVKEYAFDEETTTVLDYACGTGTLTRDSLVFNHVQPPSRHVVAGTLSSCQINCRRGHQRSIRS